MNAEELRDYLRKIAKQQGTAKLTQVEIDCMNRKIDFCILL